MVTQRTFVAGNLLRFSASCQGTLFIHSFIPGCLLYPALWARAEGVFHVEMKDTFRADSPVLLSLTVWDSRGPSEGTVLCAKAVEAWTGSEGGSVEMRGDQGGLSRGGQ
jgi:hypothetical protein